MKYTMAFIIFLISTLLLASCRESREEKDMQSAKQHMQDAAENIKAAGSDAIDAAKTKTDKALQKAKEKAKEESSDLLDAASEKAKAIKDKSNELINNR